MRSRSLARAAISTAVSGALGAAMLAAPALAYADGPAAGAGPDPVIGAVGSATGDAGLLDVAVSSDSAVTQITATLTKVVDSGTQRSVVVTDFQLLSGTAEAGVWESARLGDLPGYGTYSVDVSAVDADGDTGQAAQAGSVDFLLTAVVTGQSIGPAVLDYAHPKLTARGTVGVFDPETGQSEPLADTTLWLNASDLSESTVTDDQGGYSFTEQPSAADIGAPLPVSVNFWLDQGDSGPNKYVQVDSATLATKVSPVRIRLDHPSTKINYGAAVANSGVVEYQYGGTWRAAPGVPLVLASYGTATTNAQGRFAISYPYPAITDGSWTVATTRGAVANPYLAAAQATFKVDVVNKLTISWSRSSLDADSMLHIEGSMSSSNSKLPADKRIYVQQSANGKTGWTTLGSFTAGGAGTFKLDAYMASPKGYWRLHTAASADYLSGYSNTVHFTRIGTRITGFNAGPEPVAKGHTISVTGTLSRLSAAAGTKWATWSAQRVYVYFLPAGKKTYTYLGSTLTNASGHFTRTFTATQDGTWVAAWFTANNAYVNAQSVSDAVDVR